MLPWWRPPRPSRRTAPRKTVLRVRRRPRLPAPLAVVVLVTGMTGQVAHTAAFFLPALAAMTMAALRLWREGA